MRLAILFLLAGSAFGACTNPSTGIWRCADTGDEYTNGSDFAQFLLDQNYACGDTIILDAGATYTGSTTLQGAYRLKQQFNCPAGKYTRIISSSLGNLPKGRRIQPSDKPYTAILRTRTSYPVFEIWYFANNWSLEGLTLANHQRNHDLGITNSTLAMQPGYDPATTLAWRPENIRISRCLSYPIEEELYGSAVYTSTEGRTFLRTASVAFSGIYAKNFIMEDSYIYGYTGYQDLGTVSFTSVSNANPAVISGTGITAALGLSTGALSDSRCSGITGCNGNCQEAGGCARTVLVGATSNWADMNGHAYLRVVDANNVSVHKMGKAFYIPVSATTAYDSTSKGAFTGTLEVHKAGLLTQYAFYSPAGVNYRLVNNHLESWAMNIFLGGSDPVPYDTATVQSGSTSTSIVLDHVRKLAVGMLITVDAAGRSAYCTSPSWGCYGGGLRIGEVTAINGNTVTVQAVGADGIDVSPTVGGKAIWQGPINENFEIRRNAVYKNDLHHAADAGKGPIEMKSCVNCLIDGNVMGPNVAGNYFLTVRNQGGYSPWMKGENVRYSNNVSAGPITTSIGSNLRLTALISDNEHTSTLGSNVVYEHNIHPDAQDIGAGSVAFMDGNALLASGWRHNTLTAQMAYASMKFFQHFDCTTAPTMAREASPSMILKDNVVSYGVGAVNGSNCPDVSSAILSNLFVDTLSVGTSTITSAWPGNAAVANYTGLFTGTCSYPDWEGCRLSVGSGKRGTASDGGDPGADIEQVKDRLNGWSDDAGLLKFVPTLPGAVNNPAAFGIGSTAAVIRFRITGPVSGCTVQLFTNRNRATAHSDTSSPAACNRTGSLVDGPMVQFVAGTVAALTASTRYFYKITDGSKVMVGEFSTIAAAGSSLNLWFQVFDAAAYDLVVEYSLNSDMSGYSTTAAYLFSGSRATALGGWASGSVYYARTATRNSGGTVLQRSPVRVVVAP